MMKNKNTANQTRYGAFLVGLTLTLTLTLAAFAFAFAFALTGCDEEQGSALNENLKVEYYLNGATGTAPVDEAFYRPGAQVTVKSAPAVDKAPSGTAAFYGWSTSEDGYGAFYQPNAAFTIAKTTRLYALWQGDGTNPDYPKLVSTAAELKAIGLSDHVALAADIDNMDAPLVFLYESAPNNYVPVSFTGTFDGRGHKVTLNITKSGTVTDLENHIGLFSMVRYEAAIKNVHVTGSIKVTANQSDSQLAVGGIIGLSDASASTSTIKNCVSTVNITVSSPTQFLYVGGLVGCAIYGIRAENCYYSGTISSTSTTTANPSNQAHSAAGIIGGLGSPLDGENNAVLNSVSLANITWVNKLVFTQYERQARQIMGGYNSYGVEDYIDLTNNYARGTVSMTDKNGKVTTQQPNNDFDGAAATAADIESESWWRETVGWEKVWGGEEPTTEKPWVWDAEAKRPKLHKFD